MCVCVRICIKVAIGNLRMIPEQSFRFLCDYIQQGKTVLYISVQNVQQCIYASSFISVLSFLFFYLPVVSQINHQG